MVAQWPSAFVRRQLTDGTTSSQYSAGAAKTLPGAGVSCSSAPPPKTPRLPQAAWAGPSFGLDMPLIFPFPRDGGVRAERVGSRRYLHRRGLLTAQHPTDGPPVMEETILELTRVLLTGLWRSC